jgi:hypothetical protein
MFNKIYAEMFKKFKLESISGHNLYDFMLSEIERQNLLNVKHNLDNVAPGGIPASSNDIVNRTIYTKGFADGMAWIWDYLEGMVDDLKEENKDI